MTEYDVFERGIGITTLASDRGTVDDIRESSPIAISGVALPENTVLEGGQGVRHFYPAAMAQRAADVLQSQLDDPDQTVHLVKNFHELDGQATADDIIGEVTSVGYSQGVGVVFGGEITDQDIAEKIALGYLDISPTVARALGGEMDDQMEARPVTDVAGFRDIAVVGNGQPGASVEVGQNPAIEALARAPAHALSLDTLEVSDVDFNGYDESAWDAPTLEGTYDGDMDAARNAATWIDGDGENFEDLSLFVLNGDGELNVNALDSAWRLAPQTDGPTEDDVARLRAMYEDMAEEANDAGAITDAEFDDVWQDRVADTDTNHDTDTMSVDEAKRTVAEAFDIDVETLEERLSESETDPDSEPDENTVVLVEADADD